jgi:hypothetical protein
MQAITPRQPKAFCQVGESSHGRDRAENSDNRDVLVNGSKDL